MTLLLRLHQRAFKTAIFKCVDDIMIDEKKYKIADEQFREIMGLIKGHTNTLNALSLAGHARKKLKLDYNQLTCTISLTHNEVKLLCDLLLAIPVNNNSLSYECAKSILKKMEEDYEKQSKNKKDT